MKSAAIYEKLQHQNVGLLKLISAELKSHEAKAKKGGLHYGYVGDLEHVKELLKELLTSLRGGDDEEQMRAKIEEEINK